MVPVHSKTWCSLDSETTNNDRIWLRWNSASNGTTSIVWDSWNRQHLLPKTANVTATATTASTVNVEIWGYWNSEWQTLHPYAISPEEAQRRRDMQRVVDANQDAALQRANEEARRREAALRKMREEAEEKAEALLLANLTPEQRDELKRLHHFHLIVGDKRYRIRRGRTRNIELVDVGGKVLKTLCAHPRELVPTADTMLAQKLMLQHAEEEFLKLANVS